MVNYRNEVDFKKVRRDRGAYRLVVNPDRTIELSADYLDGQFFLKLVVFDKRYSDEDSFFGVVGRKNRYDNFYDLQHYCDNDNSVLRYKSQEPSMLDEELLQYGKFITSSKVLPEGLKSEFGLLLRDLAINAMDEENRARKDLSRRS
ncbi:MAG: hypothetical protein AABY10_06230 [Nanoarchaeota archaeon]